MIKENEYKAFMARLNAPENAKLRASMDDKLAFHLKRIEDYVEYQGQTANAQKELMELDYIVSMREANKRMDEQGWK